MSQKVIWFSKRLRFTTWSARWVRLSRALRAFLVDSQGLLNGAEQVLG